MRLATITATVLALSCFSAMDMGSATASQPPTPSQLRCSASSGATVLDVGSSLLFRATVRVGGKYSAAFDFGCVKPRGHVYPMPNPFCPVLSPCALVVAGPTLAGTYVGYEVESVGVDTGPAFGMVLWNVATGRYAYTPPFDEQLDPDSSTVVKVAANGHGALAWSAQGYAQVPAPSPRIVEICVLDSRGGVTVASGTDIDPSSLAVSGSQVYWSQDGAPQTAPFEGSAPEPVY
jgi:hypothetical protein